MKRTRLGKDGPEISRFGIGAMPFAGIYGNATAIEAHADLDAGMDADVSHIDTAAGREAFQRSPFLKTNQRFKEPDYSANLRITDAFRALAKDMGVPAAALAIAWLIAQGGHVIPIPGTKSAAHLAELVGGLEIELSAGDLAAIERVLPVGWAHGDRYSEDQWSGPEKYC